MVGRLDLDRLAARIERVGRAGRHGWHPGDELEVRGLLQRLPAPEALRAMNPEDVQQGDWRVWMQLILRAEGLVRDNDPRNPKGATPKLTFTSPPASVVSGRRSPAPRWFVCRWLRAAPRRCRSGRSLRGRGT